MPALWEKLVKQLGKKKKVSNPYALATWILQKNKYLKKGTRELTKKGRAKGVKNG